MKHFKIVAVLSLVFALLVGLPLAAQTAAGGTTGTTTATSTGGTTGSSSGTASASGSGTVASTTPDVGSPNANTIGVDTAQQKLKEVSVDKFEEEGFWVPVMSTDEGLITDRLFIGSPAGKANDPLPDERLLNIDNKVADTHVLGVRVQYLHRGYTEFEILAKKPIPIEGVTKTISVWVVGRNFDNQLKIILADYFGRQFELPMGTLNFQGWKKLTVAVPPQAADGVNGIIQRNYHYSNHMGLKVLGFKVECDPLEAYGTYYVYFDDLRAVTDLFAEDNRDPDDMSDAW